MKKAEPGAAKIEEALRHSGLFDTLPWEMTERYILPLGQAVEYGKQEFIYTPEQRDDRVGIILSGTVHILNLFSDGDYSLMSVLSPFRVIGEGLIFTRTGRPPYYAMCATRVTVLFFPKSLFAERGELPEPYRIELLQQLLALLSRENMQKYYRIAILSQKGLRQRILTYLIMQANKRRVNTFDIPFNREEMASFLCVNRSALSHELSLMKQEGLIDFRKKSFTLLPKGEAQGTWWRPPEQEPVP